MASADPPAVLVLGVAGVWLAMAVEVELVEVVAVDVELVVVEDVLVELVVVKLVVVELAAAEVVDVVEVEELVELVAAATGVELGNAKVEKVVEMGVESKAVATPVNGIKERVTSGVGTELNEMESQTPKALWQPMPQ